MKQIIIVTPSFGAGTRISYEIPFTILASRRLIGFRIVLESSFKQEDLKGVDFLILYRCMQGNTLSLVYLARKKGIRVIYEIDDDLLNPPEDEPWGQRHLRCGVPQIVRQYLEKADLVKAGSPLLARRIEAEGYSAVYLPFPIIIRERGREEEHGNGVIRIGYFGTRHHQKDINMVFPALQAIAAEFPEQVEFDFFGCAPEGWRSLTKARFWSFDWDYERFLDSLASRRWQIGLAPLRPISFNEAKSNGKFRDYAAAGIPGIYANLPPYRDCVVHNQNGYLCSPDHDEWVFAIRSLIIHPMTRERLVKEAQEIVRMDYKPETAARNWESLFESLG